MPNKYLEKIAVNYQIEVPQSSSSPWQNTNKILLNKKEYSDFGKEYEEKNTLTRKLSLAGLNGVAGALSGAVLSNMLFALSGVRFDPVHAAKVGAAVGGVLGASSGLNHAENISKAEALRKHFPELDDSWKSDK